MATVAIAREGRGSPFALQRDDGGAFGPSTVQVSPRPAGGTLCTAIDGCETGEKLDDVATLWSPQFRVVYAYWF